MNDDETFWTLTPKGYIVSILSEYDIPNSIQIAEELWNGLVNRFLKEEK